MAERQHLVLCPGLLCDHALWSAQSRALSDLAAPSVADFTRAESIADMARSVLDAAPDRFALAGLSMGGYVAQEVIRRAPGHVTRLALLDTSARPESAEQTRRRRELLALAARGRFDEVTPRLLPLLVAADRLADEALCGAIAAMAGRVGPEAFARQQQAIMGRADGRGDLPRIACPTLVLCGREDRLTPVEHHTELAERVPSADLVVLAGCGHMSAMERPDAVSAALRHWLARATSS